MAQGETIADFGVKKEPYMSVNTEQPDPQHDQYLIRIEKGERLYKFYFFRPIAGRSHHFEYRVLTKEKNKWNVRNGEL
jgi:hypothetical protein